MVYCPHNCITDLHLPSWVIMRSMLVTRQQQYVSYAVAFVCSLFSQEKRSCLVCSVVKTVPQSAWGVNFLEDQDRFNTGQTSLLAHSNNLPFPIVATKLQQHRFNQPALYFVLVESYNMYKLSSFIQSTLCGHSSILFGMDDFDSLLLVEIITMCKH